MNSEPYFLMDLVKIKYGKNQKKVEDENGNIPILGTGGVIGYANNFIYNKPSVLIGRKGSINKVKYIDVPFWTVDTLFYTEVNEDIIIPKYLYYLMSLIDLSRYDEGTTIPSLTTKTLNSLEFSIPSLNYQDKIIKILSNLDSKIEFNSKINKNLENILKNLYNHWFVTLKHFNSEEIIDTKLGKMLSNWKIKELKDFSEDIVCGKTPLTKNSENYGGKIPFVTIPDMHNNIFVIDTERYLSEKGSNSQIKKLLPENSVCVSCIATVGLASLTTEKSHTNQQINTIVCNNESQYFLYLKMLTLSKYIEMLGSSGSTTLNLNKKQFSKIKIIVPSEKVIKEFTKTVKPIFNKIKENQLEIKKLNNLRDILLPKLMSGELDISDIQI